MNTRPIIFSCRAGNVDKAEICINVMNRNSFLLIKHKADPYDSYGTSSVRCIVIHKGSFKK